MNNIQQQLKKARLASGLTQKELAAMSHVRISTISDIETGKQDPRASTLFALARALKCCLRINAALTGLSG